MSLTKRGKYYRYSFVFHGERIQGSTGLTNANAARRAQNLHREKLARAEAGFADPVEVPPPPTLGEYAPTFLQWSKAIHRHSTYVLHSNNCAVLVRYLGSRRLDEINRAAVEDFMVRRAQEPPVNVSVRAVRLDKPRAGTQQEPRGKNQEPVRRVRTLAGTVSHATVNRAVTSLRALYHQAQGAWPQLANPCHGIELLPESEVQRIITEEEFQRYLAAAPPDLHDVAILMRERGLRPQDCCSLTRKQCDFEQDVINLWAKPEPRTKLVAVRLADGGKTRNSSRSIVMSATVRKVLEERVARAERLGTEFLFPAKIRGSVLTDQPRNPGSLGKPHRSTLRKAHINGRARLYDFRHTFATNAVRKGVNLSVIKDVLGHSDLTMTLRYTKRNDLVAQQAAFARIE